MSMTDPIADLLTRLRNAQAIRRESVDIPHSRIKESIARVLQREGYVKDVRVIEDMKPAQIRVYLKYGPDRENLITNIERVSKPGQRVYRGVDKIEKVLDGMGIGIFSTPAGLLTDRECRERKLGGEYLCRLY